MDKFEKGAFQSCINRLNQSRTNAVWAKQEGLPVASAVVAGSNTHWEEMTRIAMRALTFLSGLPQAEELKGK